VSKSKTVEEARQTFKLSGSSNRPA